MANRAVHSDLLVVSSLYSLKQTPRLGIYDEKPTHAHPHTPHTYCLGENGHSDF